MEKVKCLKGIQKKKKIRKLNNNETTQTFILHTKEELERKKP